MVSLLKKPYWTGPKPDKPIVEKFERGSKRSRAIWKKKDFACAKLSSSEETGPGCQLAT
jgi:hypothetical protein